MDVIRLFVAILGLLNVAAGWIMLNICDIPNAFFGKLFLLEGAALCLGCLTGWIL